MKGVVIIQKPFVCCYLLLLLFAGLGVTFCVGVIFLFFAVWMIFFFFTFYEEEDIVHLLSKKKLFWDVYFQEKTMGRIRNWGFEGYFLEVKQVLLMTRKKNLHNI